MEPHSSGSRRSVHSVWPGAGWRPVLAGLALLAAAVIACNPGGATVPPPASPSPAPGGASVGATSPAAPASPAPAATAAVATAAVATPAAAGPAPAASSASPTAGVGPSPAASASPVAAAGTASRVEIKAFEFAYDPKDLTVRAGEITFVVENTGAIEHNFVIEAAGGQTVAQIPNIGVRRTAELRVTLQPGAYTQVCTLPGHREAGMVGTITVTP